MKINHHSHASAFRLSFVLLVCGHVATFLPKNSPIVCIMLQIMHLFQACVYIEPSPAHADRELFVSLQKSLFIFSRVINEKRPDDESSAGACCVRSPRPLAASQQPLNATSHHSVPIINLFNHSSPNIHTLHLMLMEIFSHFANDTFSYMM